MIGKSLGHYEIIEKLGSGGMGDVYRARDTKLNREVAIKVLPEEFSGDPGRRKRFAREAQAIAALKHPNIVTIHSVEELEDVNFITMEFVEGETLAKRIPVGGVTLDQFFEYAIALADALSSAHDQGITHRDLKPANIMFDRDGRLKVLDFGLAKLLDRSAEAEGAATVVESHDTGIGQVMGTAAYMSPEQAEGKPVDHRTDIFSLGIILYQMVTGERPFKGDTQISTISAILKDHPRHISEFKTEVPRHVGRIVNHCLEKKRDKRFQSAKDVRNDLESLKKEVDSGELSESMHSGVAMAAPPKTANWKPFAVGGAVVVLAVVAIFALRPNGEGGNPSSSSRVGNVTEAAPALPSADERKMAVVLPFENLGPAEDAYFAAGMTEEIASRLSTVSGLGVISSTSANQYDRAGKTMKQIGDDLGVDYVLEGSVRWAKSGDGVGRMRITPKLIRVADDSQMWSQTYDRDADDIFEVQTDIATRVIEQLGVTLRGGEQQRLAEAPTQNMDAYKAYMRAENYRTVDFEAYDVEYVRLMEKAVELDPQFVHAWSKLSTHHSSIYRSPIDRTDERLSRARRALRKAETIAPDHYMTRLARGFYYYYGFRNYEQALQEFLFATEAMPSDAEARAAVGYIYRRQGKWAECIENLTLAAELNPRDAVTFSNLAGMYRGLREFDATIANYKKALELDPENGDVLLELSATYSDWGDDKSARRVLATDQPNFFHHFGWMRVHVMAGDYDEARASVNKIPSAGLPGTFKPVLLAQIDYMDRGPQADQESLRVAVETLESMLEQAPDNTWFRGVLAVILAMQGKGESAVREAKLCVDLDAKDAFGGPGNLKTLAVVYSLIGREEEAMDIIEQLFKTIYESSITPHSLQNDPWPASLRDNPRFQALLPRNI